MLAGHAERLEELQRIVFPTLSYEERLRAEHYRRHLEVFPVGQFVLTIGGQPNYDPGTGERGLQGDEVPLTGDVGDEEIIGMTTTMRTDFDFANYRHSFLETSGGGWLSKHQPEGRWLYGLDMGIHPDWRGRGGARLLYRERQLLVRRLGLAGQLTVGMMNGYGAVKNEIPAEQYYREWLNGERGDPTLSKQRKIGFEPLGLIPDYLHDPACGNYGVLLRLEAGKEV